MNRILLPWLCTVGFILFSCSTQDSGTTPESNPDFDDTEEIAEEEMQNELYFPPTGTEDWETIAPETLGWNLENMEPLLEFLEEKDTKAFIILKDGKIAMENYFGTTTANSNQTWNSAGKTLISMTIGIAQAELFLSITEPSSTYLGNGWSTLSPAQENAISIRNHLTMTTGLDYTVENNFCTDRECFDYLNSPGDFWFYHQGAFTLLENIITNAVGTDFETYFNEKIKEKIGMQGSFVKLGFSNFYFSNARSMAKYGLLHLSKGIWDGVPILSDTNYFDEMTTSSQPLNPSYGYLYWLNGKDTYRIPDSEALYPGKLIPSAPNDMYAGLGGNDQKLYIVPSLNMVIVRMGNDASDTNLGPSSFDDELWQRINLLIQ
ncbi:Beta-lactamase [Croceitalea dokdonensis DOKDO 023]|uniref:Beta-lactamase n=1 Tax=Croceitalea dokdonensis DOKDO 023 TaxID=1300341 RepID=A0A0P7AT62_9FLAO|nr:serine hydrolase [Croceitalea dokdonensis]KPM31587.1 Beta-lactamase [Croceitalea dokdonensis DOKDO 023]